MNSISQKVLFSLGVSIFLVLVLVGVVGYFIQLDSENKNWEETRSTMIQQLQVILKEPIYSYDKALINDIIKAYVEGDTVSYLKVIDQRDNLLAEAGTSNKDNISAEDVLNINVTWQDQKAIGSISVEFSRDVLITRLEFSIVKDVVSMLTILALLSVMSVVILRILVVKPLSQVIHLMEDIAHGGGDLTQRITYHSNDELGILANTFNSFVVTIQTIVKDVAEVTSSLLSVSHRVEHANEIANQETVEQSMLTLQVTSRLEGLGKITEEIAQNATNSAQNIVEIRHSSTQGECEMQTNLKQVDELVVELEKSAEIATNLRVSSENIGGVLDVIKSIAEQTNLLALNAAIEAARAGESGRGFAVVADEVRALASKTRDSTAEIELIIESFQDQAKSSLEATERSKKLANVAIDSARSSYEFLNAMTEQMESVDDMSARIASSSEEQRQVTGSVNNSMGQIHEGAQRLSIEAESLSESIKDLASVEDTLSDKIRQFTF